MARLPTPGGDNGTWGTILNDFLGVAHNTDGTLRAQSITDSGGQVYNVMAYGAVGDGSTDDVAAIQSTINAAATAGGGTIFFPTGTYFLSTVTTSGGVSWHLSIFAASNLTFLGGPGAILQSTSGTESPSAPVQIFHFVRGTSVASHEAWTPTIYTIGAAAKGTVTVTTATAAHAGNFSAGDWVRIRTGQTITPQSGNDAVIEADSELNQVLSAVAGTGVITLRWPLAKVYAQEYYVSGSTGRTTTSVTANPAPLGIENWTGRLSHNIAFEGLEYDHDGWGAMWVGFGVERLRMVNCRGVGGAPMSMGFFKDALIANNVFHNTGSGTFTYFLTVATGCTDVTMRDNTLTSERVSFLHLHEGAARIFVENNRVLVKSSASNENIVSIAARVYDVVIRGNTFIGSGTSASIYVNDDCVGGGIIHDNHIWPSGSALGIAIAETAIPYWHWHPNLINGIPTSATIGNASNYIMAAQPQYFFLFDEASGSISVDTSGNGRHGTIAGTMGFEAGSLIPRDPNAESYQMNGSNTNVSVVEDATLKGKTFSIVFVYSKPDLDDGFGALVNERNGATNDAGYAVLHQSGALDLFVIVDDGSPAWIQAQLGGITAGRKYLVCATYNGLELRLMRYSVAGFEEDTTAAVGEVEWVGGGGSINILIGESTNDGTNIDAKMSFVARFGYAVSPDWFEELARTTGFKM